MISSCCGQTWPLEALRQYIAWVKQTFQPALGAEAEEVLLGYWRLVRNAADRQASRSTVRMLESLIRLAQVHPPLQHAFACNKGHRLQTGTAQHPVLRWEGACGLQAHARLMARQVVLLQDAVAAVLLAEESMLTSAVLGERMEGRATSDVEDPDAEHAEREQRILQLLRSAELAGSDARTGTDACINTDFSAFL